MYEGVGELQCQYDDCNKAIPNHRWGKIKAEGWFFSREDNVVLCPEHVPTWYVKWRKSKGKS